MAVDLFKEKIKQRGCQLGKGPIECSPFATWVRDTYAKDGIIKTTFGAKPKSEFNIDELRKQPGYVRWLKASHMLITLRDCMQEALELCAPMIVKDIEPQLSHITERCKAMHVDRPCYHCGIVLAYFATNHDYLQSYDDFKKLDKYCIYENPTSNTLSATQLVKMFMSPFTIASDSFMKLDLCDLSKFFLFYIPVKSKINSANIMTILRWRYDVFHSLTYTLDPDQFRDLKADIEALLGDEYFNSDPGLKAVTTTATETVKAINGELELHFVMIEKEVPALKTMMSAIQKSIQEWQAKEYLKPEFCIHGEASYEQIKLQGEELVIHMRKHVNHIAEWISENVIGEKQIPCDTTVKCIMAEMDDHIQKINQKVTCLSGKVGDIETLSNSLESTWSAAKENHDAVPPDVNEEALSALTTEMKNFIAVWNDARSLAEQLRKEAELGRLVQDYLNEFLRNLVGLQRCAGPYFKNLDELKQIIMCQIKEYYVLKTEVESQKKNLKMVNMWFKNEKDEDVRTSKANINEMKEAMNLLFQKFSSL